MHESESNLDSLTQYENNTASSNLQVDIDDLSWEEENNSLDQTNDMIVEDEGEEDKDEEEDAMLSRSLYFMGMEPTRKSREEGRYLLVTTKAKKLNAQREADNLLSKYYKKQPNVDWLVLFVEKDMVTGL